MGYECQNRDTSRDSAKRAETRCAASGEAEHGNHPPRIGGMVTSSRRQARRSISSQSRNCKSLLRQMRTSDSRERLQVTAIAAFDRPGLTLMKASSMSEGATVFGSDNCRKSGGILITARTFRMVSK